MRLPCEIVVVDILPIVRRELSIELVLVHGIRKASVARMFKVSGTAISQYVYGSRGNRSILDGDPNYTKFMKEIKRSAELLASKKSDVLEELCRLCDVVKNSGILDRIHEKNETDPLQTCAECPRDNIAQ